jgi:hypothetical protein
MDQYERAERIAQAIHYSGWDSLSIAEELSLRHEDFRKLVMSFISRLQREQLLDGSGPGGPSAESLLWRSPTIIEVLISWELRDAAFEARLWSHSRTGKHVLEIKEWGKEDFHSPIPAGRHKTVFMQTIQFDNTDELGNKCRQILMRYGCPPKRVSRSLTEWEDSE